MKTDRLFNYSALAQIVCDPYSGTVIAANQECCRILGLSTTEIQAQTMSQLFCETLPELIVFTQEVLHEGRGWTDRLEIGSQGIPVETAGRCTEAGDEHFLYFALQPVAEVDRLRKNSDADQHYQSGIGHWNRVAKVFQEFERENQLLLDAAGEGIYGVDAKGDTTFVNPAAERILGYSANELAGRNMHTMVHHSHSDGSHFHSHDCPIYAAFTEAMVQTVEDDVFWHKSGRAIDVEYTSTPIMEQGEIMGAVVIFRDITQKKTDQRRLLAALAEVEELKNRLEMENAYLLEEISSEFNHHRLIGRSPALQRCLQQIDLVAPTQSTVLIHGESGTGKELIARAIHEHSDRAARPLIRVNCAAIPEELFESEFFGHIKGSFTGATHDRAGRFELADGGTLFLDEVGEIPMHLQGKLLRVLQEQQFERIGDSKTRNVDVRIIAATNRNLREMVDQGQFREDLYFRLNVFPIESVPLRERKEDIPLLTRHFLDKASKRGNKAGLKIPMSEIAKLQKYTWPGNIRELENVIERQVILTQGSTMRFELISDKHDIVAPAALAETNQVMTQSELNDLDRRNIIAALKQCKGKVFGDDGAAALLQMKPTTLSSRIKKYQISTRALTSAEAS